MACGISIEFGVEFSCVDTGWIEGDGESEFSRVNSPESLLSAIGKGRTGGVELGGVRGNLCSCRLGPAEESCFSLSGRWRDKMGRERERFSIHKDLGN